VNRKGGTAAVFKVEIPMDLETGNSSGLMTYAVKQYPAAHQHSFKREVNALSILHTQKTAATNIVRCYGTFEHFTFGETTYNLVLEYGESDLSDYWARNPTPHDSVVLEQFWVSLLGIVEAVSRIHDAELSDSIVYHGVHADIKPDNILCFNGTLKLADFGFTNFTYAHNQSSWEALRVIGGTAAYGKSAMFASNQSLTNRPQEHQSLQVMHMHTNL
jgi:serine/threonine protein kinase